MKLGKKTIAILFFCLIGLSFSSATLAACSYHCNDDPNKTAADFCYGIGGNMGGLGDCTGQNTCGMYSVRVCCCNTGNFTVNNGQITNNATPPAPAKAEPKFKIPEIAIKIPGMAEFSEAQCTGTPPVCTVNWIGEYIGGVYQYAVGIAGIAAVIVLMIGGIIWLVSGGDASKITQSKELIVGSISGLILLLCSYMILYEINPDLTKFKALTLGYIEEVFLPEDGSDSEANNVINAACPADSSLVDIKSIVSTTAGDPRLTPGTIEGLKKAIAEADKQGVKLLVASANRSFATQQKLWEDGLKIYKDEATTRKYVAKPSTTRCGGHMAGVAIDVCIKGTASCSKMGFSNKANAKYSDTDVTKLQNIMKNAGWLRYCGEWWHFQYNAKPGVSCSP